MRPDGRTIYELVAVSLSFFSGPYATNCTAGEFKHSRLVIIGFFLFGLAEYMIFAPVYWLVFMKNLGRSGSEKREAVDSQQ